MIRLFCLGFFILITALAANFLASKLQFKTWYDFIYGLASSSDYWTQVTFKDLLWLFILYPLLLGLGASLGQIIFLKLLSS